MVDVLNEARDLPRCVLLCNPVTRAFVSGQGLSEDGDKWAGSRQENRVLIGILLRALGRDVQSRECLSCARDPCHEANRLPSRQLRPFYDLCDAVGGKT